MYHWFKLVRFPNLLILLLCQLSVIWLLARNTNAKLLYSWELYIVLLATVLTAAWGNLHNDLIDRKIDLHKKLKRTVVGLSIPADLVLKVLIFLAVIIGVLALIIVAKIAPAYLSIYPILSVFLLFSYNKNLKNKGMWGNLTVSFLVALSILFVFNWSFSQIDSNVLINTVAFFIVFAFSSTLFRELVKDMEDIDIDSKVGARTYAMSRNPKTVLNTALTIHICILVLLIGYSVIIEHHWVHLGHICMVFMFGLYLLFWISKKWNLEQWNAISRIYKWFMLAGISLLWTI